MSRCYTQDIEVVGMEILLLLSTDVLQNAIFPDCYALFLNNCTKHT